MRCDACASVLPAATFTCSGDATAAGSLAEASAASRASGTGCGFSCTGLGAALFATSGVGWSSAGLAAVASGQAAFDFTAAAAEAWCVDNITIPVATLSANQPFWVRLDYRADNSPGPTEQSDNSGITLTGLIDIFSRRTRSEQIHGSDEVGPLRLESLKRK